MKKKYEKLEVKKDQLLPEWNFIYFCNDDQANSMYGWRRMEVDEQFLRAAEKDGLIKPFFQEEGKVRQRDGSVKDGLVKYYSRHQIYILAVLRGNIVDEDGNLNNPNTLNDYKERPKEQRPRYVSWARGMAFGANNPRRKDDGEVNTLFDVRWLPEYLQSFLELLHGLEPLPRQLQTAGKQRLWSNVSILEYDFKPLKAGGENLLELYGLDERKLNILRANVAQFAELIDPLAHWHYYVNRHPELKKDLLKGDASLAQEIYRLYDLLTEAWEAITKKKSEPIFEFLHKDSHARAPFYAPKTEYLQGGDLQAMKYAIQQFKKWKLKKDNKPFVSKEVAKYLAALEQELDDYEKKYGDDRGYVGNLRWVHEDENIQLDDLDEKTRRRADATLIQMKDANVKQEIYRAIGYRLEELQRELRQIFWSVSVQFRDKESVAWQEVNGNNGNSLWNRFIREGKFQGLDRVQQMELLNTERNKLTKEALGWQEKAKNFSKTVSWYADVVFCKVCRAKPVRLHIENTSRNIWEASLSVICDDCFANINQNSLTADDEWWKKTNQAEWRCQYCNGLLYKFAYGNTLSAKTLNKVPVKIEVLYGKAIIQAKCPNPKCGGINERFIDWGWLP
jgi:hypothetical protein